MKKLDAFLAACQHDLSYSPEAKDAFHKASKAILKEVSSKAALSGKVTNNMAGIACSGEVHLKTSNLEVMISQFMGKVKVLYRTLNGNQSGRNQYIEPEQILEDSFISKLQKMESA